MYKMLLIIVSMFCFAGCRSQNEHGSSQKKAINTTVMVLKPERKNIEGKVELPGGVMPNQEVKLYAMVSGMVSSLKVDIGSFVLESEILATIQNPEVTQRQQKAEADFLAAKTNYERMATVAKQTPDLITARDLERAKADYDGAQAILRGMNETVALMNIRAPFSGVITRRYLNKGAIVQSGTTSGAAPLVDIMDLSVVRVVVDVPETDVTLVQVGTPVTVRFFEVPDGKIRASVSRISYSLKAESKTMRLEIDVQNAKRTIRPGMSASVLMEFSAHPDALIIPNEAIMIYKGDPCVFRVVEGVVERIPVKLGFRDTKFSEVLSGTKLQEHDQIVVRGKELITEGEHVQTTEQ